ncbi:sterol desaturase family protein [Zhouia spongiae]|uniref:Sterol desaturase family protein n=1 Tax=Zhouia spongiae TaxID=2202721 RepID=A0ABY3YJC3_9FLAO|nr:sterol desaturase family protein [Zhouia spongiae]UNY97596.1 sterol desaturase family protein [Zhouia spongiae]
METYAKALLFAIPVFVILVLIEILYGYLIKKHTHKPLDTISSLSSGLTNIVKDSLPLILIFVSYPTLLKHLSLFRIETTWITYAIGFVALDFAGYWNHRLSHRINFFWNQHVIHHSSEEFNLACALRQSISNILGYFPLLLIPAAVMGVPAKVINILAPIHLFLQFWYHTKYIGKLGWLEYIIVTPSQHRVHHAINPEYIDKNLGQIFSIWDRLFGTFQEELNDIPPVYGVLKPAQTWNPILINFQHLWRLIKDAWHAKSWVDKLRIWFMPTGWRPEDVKEKYPYSIIENVYSFHKYETKSNRSFISYAAFQLLVCTALMMFMFYNYTNIGLKGLLLYGGFVFTGIFGYTSLMDHKNYAKYIEYTRGLAGIMFILYTKDWFGIDEHIAGGSLYVTVYFAVTIIGGWYFSSFNRKQHTHATI